MRISPFQTIKARVMICFSALILVTLLIFYGISLRYTEETVLENSIDYTSRLVNQVNSDIDYYINYMQNIAAMVVRSYDIQAYFQRNGDEEKLHYERILTQFQTVIETREDIANIAVISRDGQAIINRGTDRLNPNVSLEEVDWYQDALACEDYVLTASHVQYVIDNNYKWVVTLSRPIREAEKEASGIFFIDLNYKLLKDLCEQNSLGLNSYIFIMDETGNVIYHPKQQLLFRSLTSERIEDVLTCEDTYFIAREGKDSKLYTISKSQETGWYVVGVVTFSALMSRQEETQNMYLLTATVLVLSGILLAILLANAITRPIKTLRKSMSEVERGNFEGANITDISPNEIGALSNSFNIMTQRIRQLMEENVYEQEQKRKSEMKALKSQMNPHFLYNTLDSIIWMAEGGKNKEVVLMTSSLAKLLRQNISNEDEMIPLWKEMEYTRSYLTIQKMRYRDKLDFQIEIEDGLKQELIINLVLQPLVENAIYHGIKNKNGKGTIQVTAARDGEDLILQVVDDGAGMDEDTLQHIFDRSRDREKAGSNGVGIYNVHMRLKMYYGEEYGLSFYSVEGQGTRVSARLRRQSERRKSKRMTKEERREGEDVSGREE